MNNAMLSLQFCEPRGMNMAVSLETLHVICLGYMVHLLQGFSQIWKLIKRTKKSSQMKRKEPIMCFPVITGLKQRVN